MAWGYPGGVLPVTPVTRPINIGFSAWSTREQTRDKPVPGRAKAPPGEKNILLLLTLIGFDWLLLGLIRFGRVVQRRDASAALSGCDGPWHFLQSRDLPPGNRVRSEE